ncbi:hypothetical protein JB92DRAFT_2838182 [Gautieria morchelliformis]|nr:hypothetical protein JB92DRAFT_2838182 [Gautieria morchelliformis]
MCCLQQQYIIAVCGAQPKRNILGNKLLQGWRDLRQQGVPDQDAFGVLDRWSTYLEDALFSVLEPDWRNDNWQCDKSARGMGEIVKVVNQFCLISKAPAPECQMHLGGKLVVIGTVGKTTDPSLSSIPSLTDPLALGNRMSDARNLISWSLLCRARSADNASVTSVKLHIRLSCRDWGGVYTNIVFPGWDGLGLGWAKTQGCGWEAIFRCSAAGYTQTYKQMNARAKRPLGDSPWTGPPTSLTLTINQCGSLWVGEPTEIYNDVF